MEDRRWLRHRNTYLDVERRSPWRQARYKLGLMVVLRASFLIALALALFGCERDQPVDQLPHGSPPPEPAAPVASRFAGTGWPDDAGPVVVLRANNPGEVRLVLPELTDNSLRDTSSFELDSLPNSAVTLYSRDGKAYSTTITAGGIEEIARGCKTWPTARLGSGAGDDWRFGLAANVAEEIPLLTWGSRLAADSAHAAAEIIRIASRAGGDSTFGGVPLAVRFLYRLELGGSRVIVADALRRINTEANVREQHSLIVAERLSGAVQYSLSYRETQTGSEEDVRVPEVIGAVRLGENRRPALFVSLEYSEGARLLLLERFSATQWVLRWRSAYSGC